MLSKMDFKNELFYVPTKLDLQKSLYITEIKPKFGPRDVLLSDAAEIDSIFKY